MPHKCWLIIILDCIIYAYEKYYPQIFLEEWKNAKENIKTKDHIDEELKSESHIDTYTNTDNDTDTNTDNDIDIDIDKSGSNNNDQIF